MMKPKTLTDDPETERIGAKATTEEKDVYL